MGSYLLLAAVLGVCALLWWTAYRLEPHWVSKDGKRVVCYGQPLDRRGAAQGRWREVKVAKVNGNSVEVRVRRGSLVVDRHASPGSSGMSGFSGFTSDVVKRRGRKPSYWRVLGQTPSPPRRRVVYILNSCNDPALPDMLAVRLPANSKAIAMFESVAVNRQADARSDPSQPSRETSQSEAQPDRD